ncbi:MAG: hypothetical protein BGO01_16090 [Armatimonadetes bacterium 55-13]|nr:redoxin domain-containing protein [Armatimonadota bacterium]ODU53120.1 MAG: hypothetical protein ABT09_02060 [bacterium SCN 57-13]OJU65379.1 MAG: hypothetical protein BGO01_16090 [Armatimonadetes bacterium 55-13]
MKWSLGFLLLTASVVSTVAWQAQSNAKKAPVLSGNQWFNLSSSRKAPSPQTSGKVTLVHFWTFACSNCQANLPIYNRLFDRYKGQGLDFVGVHTPELSFEKNVENVQKAIAKEKIGWPVLIDNEGANWNRWGLHYWPTVFLVNAKGAIVFKWEGELNWNGQNGEWQLDAAIRRALGL